MGRVVPRTLAKSAVLEKGDGVGDRLDAVGSDRAVGRRRGQAGSRPRTWVALWLLAILVAGVVMAINRAPAGAYEILLVVAVAAGSANGRSGRR